MRDVDVTPAGFVATSFEPWLEVCGFDTALAGGFVEVSIRASLLDRPARPILRFIRSDGAAVERLGAAPIVGATVWLGRVPPGTSRVAISPTNEPGPFGCIVEHVRARKWPGLLLSGRRRRPTQTRSALLTRLIGWKPESDNNLAWATGAFDLAGFADWQATRERAVDLDGLDRPRFDWATSPTIVVVIRAGADSEALGRTLLSLRAQVFDRWEALLVGADSTLADSRARHVGAEAAAALLGRMSPEQAVASIEAGDTLPPYALAFVAEQHRRQPAAHILYGDETATDRPLLKPGWSPRLQVGAPYLGRAVFALGTNAWSTEERRAFIADGALPNRFIETPASRDEVRPLRRILVRTATKETSARPAAIAASEPRTGPPAAIIVPTADHPALLRRALASVRAKSPPNTRIVVVDNGKAAAMEDATTALALSGPDVTLLRRPGPFNFSAFCNEAVAACDEQLLVFLNDDTEVLSDGWLTRLAALAFDPGTGAVGARLTFPDGRLQHAGVLVGMGESAGHLGAMAPGEDPGWAGRNVVVHEVSAVTGACLAVERDKFLAVGGFDAEHLPVELSDIDLCLKLNARGWQTVVDPGVHLMHEESASRGGATFRRLDVYDSQRRTFIERWRHVLRDDPFFHPGLSLYSLTAALG